MTPSATMLPLLGLAMPARAGTLYWSFSLARGHVATVAVETPAGREIARWLAADGRTQTGGPWVRDGDPARERVSGEVQLWLPEGDYIVREELPGEVRRRRWRADPAPRTLPVRLPPGATGVEALPADGPGLAWAPAERGGIAFLPIGEGRWKAHPLGVIGYEEEEAQGTLSFRRRERQNPRTPDRHLDPLVRFGLVPVTALLAVAGARSLRRAPRGFLPACLLFAVLGLWVTAQAWVPGDRLLQAPGAFTDPSDSVALIASVRDALGHLSATSTRFGWPEGHQWLNAGPAWLGYLLVAAIPDPLVAHDLGAALGTALLGLLAWWLARGLGARPGPAVVAGAGAALAPVWLAELDKLSLDRTTLFLVPPALLGLHRAAERPGWRWPVAAGVALAAVFYGQVYYGVYLTAAAPFLSLPRLVGPRPLCRLGRLALTGAVAVVVLAPGLALLHQGTTETIYHQDTRRLSDLDIDLLHPVDASTVAAAIAAHSPRHGGDANELMRLGPRGRLLAAMANALPPHELVDLGATLPGRALYWGLAGLGVLLATRRRAALVALTDTATLLVFALGPFLRTATGALLAPLPYYLPFLLVPGFEQLRHPERFAMLAASTAAVPVALGLSGLVERLGRPALGLPLAVLLSAGMVGMRVTGAGDVAAPSIPLGRRAGGARLVLLPSLPRARAWPSPKALSGLHGPALVLPLEYPLPPEAVLAIARSDLSVVNQAPYGAPTHLGLPPLVDVDPWLNELAWRSGSDRQRKRLSLADPRLAERETAKRGLRYVVLFRHLLAGPELVAPTEAWLDARAHRVADDGRVAVWQL